MAGIGLDDLRDDLRQEQNEILAKLDMPIFEQKKQLQQQQQQQQTTANGVAAIHARTSALNAELEFHKDLLNQLMTPPGKGLLSSSRSTDFRTQSVTRSQRSLKSGDLERTGPPTESNSQWRKYDTPMAGIKQEPLQPPLYRKTSPSASSFQAPLSSSSRFKTPSSAVGDAYGSLLHELQAVRQQVSQFVETASTSPIQPNMKVPEVRQHQSGSNYHRHNAARSSAGTKFSPPVKIRDEIDETRHSARKSRQKAMGQYRARLLEEREKIIDDLESRISKAAMRSSRNVLRDSRMRPRDIDVLHHHGSAIRRKKQQNIAEECFAEVHEALRNMRAELDEEKVEAEATLRHNFEQDRDQMIETMREACQKEREEHIKRLVASLEESKRISIQQQRQRMNANIQHEIEDMKMRLKSEHTPALQVIREGALEKRTQTLAEEELKLRGQLESEMSVLRGKLEAETQKAVEIQRVRMIDEHRHRAESLTQDILHQQEKHLRDRRAAMTRAHQEEQEVVLKELSEALSFGVRSALEEHAENLKSEMSAKIERLKQESARQQAKAIKDLEQKFQLENEQTITLLKNSSTAETDLIVSRMKAELSADHSSRLHKLKLDYADRKKHAENEMEMKFESEFQEKVAEFDNALRQDMAENVSRLEQKFADKLKRELEVRRAEADKGHAGLLATAEKKFHEDLSSMTKFVDNFFSGRVAESEPSSPSASERHMPTTKRAIQSRLASLSEQFETYKSRYKRATMDLASLQDEIVELRQKVRSMMRSQEFL